MFKNKKYLFIGLAVVISVFATGYLLFFKETKKTKVLKQVEETYVSERTEHLHPSLQNANGYFSASERKILFDIIYQTIQKGLNGQEPIYPDLSEFPEKWRENKAVYVTLNIDDKLRGCQGTKDPQKPFIYAVIDAAYRSAFHDSRFEPLTQREFDNPLFNAYVSIFDEKHKISFKNERDIIRQLTPFKDGAILSYQGKKKLKRGIYLPSVWKKKPRPESFWKGLKKKAHLKKNFWSDDFVVESFSSDNVRDINKIKLLDKKRIERALTAFKKLFRNDGSIIYYINFKTGKTATKNNIVREMGSGYALAYAYWSTKDESLKPILINFLNYAKRASVVTENTALVADDKGKIKSGATALLLLAELYYENASGDTSFSDMREKWKRGLISLYEKGYGIYVSPTNQQTSPYYDGETWLALAVYNEFYPKDKQINDLMPEINQLMYDKYASHYRYNFFHWGTQAASKQYQLNQSALMKRFLQTQLNLYLKETNITAGSSNCAYAEGLAEGLIALKGTENRELYERVMTRFENQLDIPRLLQQVPYKQHQKVAPSAKTYLGLFFQKLTDFRPRNDTTQHCLISLLKAQRVFDEME